MRAERFDLNQYYRQAVDGGRLDGKLYGLPFKLHPSFCVLYCNPTPSRDRPAVPGRQQPPGSRRRPGAAPEEDGRGGGQPAGGILLPVPGQAAQFWFTWGRSWGADLYSADGKKAQLDDPKFLAAVQFLHDLAFKHQVAPDLNQLNAIRGAGTGFEEGFGGLTQGSSSQKSMPTRIGGKFQVGDFLWPKGPTGQRGSIAISDYIHIATQSHVPGRSLGADQAPLRQGDGHPPGRGHRGRLRHLRRPPGRLQATSGSWPTRCTRPGSTPSKG